MTYISVHENKCCLFFSFHFLLLLSVFCVSYSTKLQYVLNVWVIFLLCLMEGSKLH